MSRCTQLAWKFEPWVHKAIYSFNLCWKQVATRMTLLHMFSFIQQWWFSSTTYSLRLTIPRSFRLSKLLWLMSCREIKENNKHNKAKKQENISTLCIICTDQIEKNNCLGETELAPRKALKSSEIILKATFLAKCVRMQCTIILWRHWSKSLSQTCECIL